MKLLEALFEIKSTGESGTFAGYGSVYGNEDTYGDIVMAGAFTDSLEDHKRKKTMPAMLWQHRSGEVCGVYTDMKEDANGLYVEGKFALKTQRGAEAYELVQMSALNGLSIGYQTREDSFDQKLGIRSIKKADLWEVSLVTFPANDKARIAAVKAIDEITDFKSAEHFLRESGSFSRSEATALVARIKGLAQRESGADNEASRLIEALTQRTALLT